MNTFMEKNQKLIIGVVVVLGLFLLVSTVKVMRESRYVGSGLSATNIISVTGKGEVERSPDTAKIAFSVRVEKKDLKAGQDEVSGKIDAIKKDLIAAGIEEKYIKTDSYTSYPQYDYPRCYGGSCPTSNPTLRGYEVSHAITVSIKDLTKVDAVLGILAQGGVTDMNGPNFGFEDDKAVAREARDLAIADARAEADKLASSLGVRIVRIVSFSENGGGYPVPMYASRDAMALQAGKAEVSNPVIPVGVNKVESNVTIVYEIR